MSIKLYKSTIEDRVTKLADNYGGDTHAAFLRLVFHLVTGKGYDDLEPEDVVDGAGEYQIDIFHTDDSSTENQATVTIIQATFSDSLSSTKLTKLHAGLDFTLIQPKSAYSKLLNKSLAAKIQEFRDIRATILPSNIRFQCFYANLADPAKAAGEFPEQQRRILADYGKCGLGNFEFKALGPLELFELLDRKERRGTKITDRLKIVYDQNKANLIEHSIEGVSGIICTIPAIEIARIVNSHPTVFEENLRQFLGFGGAINRGILESCSSTKDSSLFWFLNNGITIVCENFEVNKDYDNGSIALTNPQIVNGCQTSATIASAQRDGKLLPEARVMVRIFKTSSPDLASKLVVTTNTQNKVTARDLCSNDPIQQAIQSAFAQKFSLLYERKTNEFAGKPPEDQKRIISNQKIGQAYLSIVVRKPSDGGRRMYKVWGDEYSQIFSSNVFPESYLLALRILEACSKCKRAKIEGFAEGEIKRAVLANGVYHIARIVSFLWRKGDDWNDRREVERDLQKLQDEPGVIDKYFDQALEIVVNALQANPQFAQDLTTGLKSGRLDEDINKRLYTVYAQLK